MASRDLLVLCYHAVSDRWPSQLAVRPADLRAQLEEVLRRGYTPATFTEAVLRPPAARTLAVTFDDGYRSTLVEAFPVLERLGVHGTVFVPTAFPGATRLSWPGIDGWLDGQHAEELRPCAWQDLAHLRRAGWEVGSHTARHPWLPHLDDAALAAELGRSRDAVAAHLGDACPAIAYPYGAVDRRVAAAARRAGYAAGAALGQGLRGDVLAVPRVGVYRRDDLRRFTYKIHRGARLGVVSAAAGRLRERPSAPAAGGAA